MLFCLTKNGPISSELLNVVGVSAFFLTNEWSGFIACFGFFNSLLLPLASNVTLHFVITCNYIQDNVSGFTHHHWWTSSCC